MRHKWSKCRYEATIQPDISVGAQLGVDIVFNWNRHGFVWEETCRACKNWKQELEIIRLPSTKFAMILGNINITHTLSLLNRIHFLELVAQYGLWRMWREVIKTFDTVKRAYRYFIVFCSCKTLFKIDLLKRMLRRRRRCSQICLLNRLN